MKKLNPQQKKQLLLIAAIIFMLAAFGYCGQQDYEEAKRSETEFCAHSESIGATDTDLYREVCK